MKNFLRFVGSLLLIMAAMALAVVSVGFDPQNDWPIVKVSVYVGLAGLAFFAASFLGLGRNSTKLCSFAFMSMIGGGGGGCLTSLVVVGFVLAGAALAFRALWRFGMTLGILLAFASPAFAGGGGGGGGIELPGICWGVLALVLIVVVILAIKDIRSKGQQ